jgi:hypothetical protein
MAIQPLDQSYQLRFSGFFNPFKAYWLRDAPTGLTLNNCTLCPHCIYVFYIYLKTNSDLCHLQLKLIGFYNRDEKCLQRGTDWAFKKSSLWFVFKGLISGWVRGLLNGIFSPVFACVAAVCGRPGSRFPAHYIIATLLNPRLIYQSCNK